MATPLAKFGQGRASPERLAQAALKNPRLLPQLLEGLNASEAKVKYGCAKALRIIAEEQPASLYPHFDFFVRLLNHPNKILQWEGILVLSHLARADTQEKFGAILEKYFAPISGPVMITAANVIGGGARIARAKPQLADRIAAELLKVANARYQTPECRNVAIGHAIRAFGDTLDLLHDLTPLMRFVRRELKNPRPATRKKAEQFLKRAARHAQHVQA